MSPENEDNTLLDSVLNPDRCGPVTPIPAEVGVSGRRVSFNSAYDDDHSVKSSQCSAGGRSLGDIGMHGAEDTSDNEENDIIYDGTSSLSLFPLTKKPSTVAIVALLFTFALSKCLLIAPTFDVMIQLICMDMQKRYTRMGTSTNSNQDFMEKCRANSIVVGKVAQFQSYNAVIVGVMGLIVTPRLAALSDRWGRKPIYMISVCAGLAGDVCTLLCILYPQTINYHFLLLSFVLAGLGGSFNTLQVINAAYITDSVDAGARVRHLGWLDSCLFAAIAVGPLLGSLIQSLTHSIQSLYFVSVTLYGIDFLILLLFLSESRTLRARRSSQAIFEENRKKDSVDNDQDMVRERRSSSIYLPVSLFSMRHVKDTLSPLKLLAFQHIKNPVGRRNGKLLVILATLSTELVMAVSSLLMIYAQYRFHWTSVATGYLLSTFGVARTFVLAVLTPLTVMAVRAKWPVLHKSFDRGDAFLVRVGLILSCLGFFAIGHANTASAFVGALLFDSLSGIQLPAVKNAIIKHGHKDRIGELLGALSILNSIGLVVFPVLFLQIFKFMIDKRPQLVFEVVGLGFLALLGVSLLLHVFDDEPNDVEHPFDEEDPLLDSFAETGFGTTLSPCTSSPRSPRTHRDY